MAASRCGPRINDETSASRSRDDSQTMVTLSAQGHGTLHGTLSKRAIGGVAVFDDLVYDRWEPIPLTISAWGRRSHHPHHRSRSAP